MSDLFNINKTNFTNDFTSDNINYHVEMNLGSIFKTKLIGFLKNGLIFEKFTVPKIFATSPNLKDYEINNTNYYHLYVSIPSSSYILEYSPDILIHDFKNWITRFVFYDLSEEEYQRRKNNGTLYFKVLSKTRDESWTEEKSQELISYYKFIWDITENISPDVMNNLNDTLALYQKYFDELPQEEKDSLNQKLQELMEKWNDTDLSDLFGQ